MYFELQEILETDTHDWKLHFTNDDGDVIIASSGVVSHFMMRFYGDRLYSNKEENLSDAKRDLRDDWLMFLDRNNESIARIYRALTEEYNPLHNYDRLEDIEIKHTGSDTVNYNGAESSTRSGNIERGKSGSETSSNGANGITSSTYVNGYNQTDPSLDNKVVTTGENVLSFSNRKDTETYNSLKDEKTFSNRSDVTSHNTTDTTTSHLRGNIGTTKSGDMIRDELSVRETNIVDLVLRKFIDEVTIYM